MVILINNEGQMCNRIKEFAHCIAHAIEKKETLINVVWGDLDQYFEHERCSIKISVEANENKAQAMGNIGKIIGKIIGKRNCKFNLLGKKYELINDPEFYDWDALFAHKDEVLGYLKFSRQYIERAQKKIDEYKTETESILVGVHVRRGDYKTWRNGKYYYTNEEYRCFFQQFAENTNKNVTFVVCTNDSELNASDLMGLNYSLKINGCDQVTDLLVLSKCDYIMAPPSTYSWWAAFIGNCKYLTIVDRGMKISPSDFEHIGDRFVLGGGYEIYKDM